MLWAADSFLTVLHKSGRFLTPEEQEHRVVVGDLFLKVYTKLAAKAVAEKQKLWRTRPKFHMLWHLVFQERQSEHNPIMGSCWMDEDAITFFPSEKTST